MTDNVQYVQAQEEVTNAESDFINGVIAFNIAELSLARAMAARRMLCLKYSRPHRFLTAPSDPLPAPGYVRGSQYGVDIICSVCHIMNVKWAVEMADEFKPEFDLLAQGVRNEVLALARVLQEFGPQLGRPRVDTLKGSRHANMKELRFSAADGEWRVAFAIDPMRKAILLVAGDKSGGSEKRFYRQLIRKADKRFDAHLTRIGRGT
jgi:hypothetical protein